MTSYTSRIAHVLAVYLVGLLSVSLGAMNGQINRAALIAAIPAAVTFTVETVRHYVTGAQSLDNLLKLGEQVEPLVEKYLPAVKGLAESPLAEKLIKSATYGKTLDTTGTAVRPPAAAAPITAATPPPETPEGNLL